MRGSQFQNPSIHDSINQNNAYKRHLHQLWSIENAPTSLPDTLVGMLQKNSCKSRARLFEEEEKNLVINMHNSKLLSAFESINRGRKLSVGRADPSFNLANTLHSPLHEFHSLHLFSKMKESKEVLNRNKKISSKINLIKSTISFSEFDESFKHHMSIVKAMLS
jgi:hypothetical protein